LLIYNDYAEHTGQQEAAPDIPVRPVIRV